MRRRPTLRKPANGSSPVSRNTKKYFQRRMMIAMAIYAFVVMLALPAARGSAEWPTKALLALAPVLPLLYVIWLMAERVRNADELEQRTHLVGLGVATAVASIFSLIAGFLAAAKVLSPEDSASALVWVFPLVMIGYGVGQWRVLLQRDFDAIMRFWNSPKPTIAAVHGPCLAGGCELALACDITIAAEDAVFGEPELRFGAGIVVMLLPWLVGPKRAKQLLLTGDDKLPARRAEAIGLVNEVVATGAALARALAIAADLAVIDTMALRETKRAINRSYEIMGMGEALQTALDIDLQIEGEGTADKRAFMEIARRDGLRAAIAWRDARFAATKGG